MDAAATVVTGRLDIPALTMDHETTANRCQASTERLKSDYSG
jgi:hypothetical protein